MKRTVALAGLLTLTTAPLALAQDAAAFRDAFLAGETGWPAVEARARDEGEVNFYYWGGSDLLNVWVDSMAVPALATKGVTLNPIRITSTKDVVDVILAEKAAGKRLGDGSVDVLWVNGENFATLKVQDGLFGSFAQLLPTSANIEWNAEDPRSLLNLRDFGVETGGAEMPWSGEQYVCAYNGDTVEEDALPATFDQLKAYLTENPGRFTYVKPPHYLGNTFVQQAVYAFNPDGTGAEPFQQNRDDIAPEELARLIAPGLEYLKSLEPLLLNGSDSGARYPEDPAAIDGMFLNGEVDFNCKFGIYAVSTGLSTGTYPEAAREFIFPEKGMIKNKNYLAIPANAPNPAAALVLVDWMTTVDAQATKLEATGFPAGIDGWTLELSDRAALESASPGLIALTEEDLEANAVPDTNATLVDVIEAVWLDYIERDSTEGIEALVQRAYETLGQ
ncbi:ABC transporter substrate-binding protein [Palleronia caenipelagi]|nr:ABC transporter substrate-binding protein [Palleronia caenipelagi]